MVKGADFSSYQDDAALQRALEQGIRFAFVKLTEGTGYVNPRAQHQLEVLRAHGLHLGVYEFLDPAAGKPQWAAFQARLEQVPHHQELLVAVDYEAAHTSDAEARAFIADGRAAGYHVGLYHSAGGYPNLGQAWFWIAEWGQRPGSCAFWQFAPGRDGDPDWDVYLAPIPLEGFWKHYAGRRLEPHYRVRFPGVAGKSGPVTLGPYKTLRRAALAALAYALRHPSRPSFTVSR